MGDLLIRYTRICKCDPINTEPISCDSSLLSGYLHGYVLHQFGLVQGLVEPFFNHLGVHGLLAKALRPIKLLSHLLEQSLALCH